MPKDNFLSLANMYGREHLVFIVDTGADAKTILWKVEQIQIVDMHHQAHGYFGLLIIVYVANRVVSNPFAVSALQNLAKNAQEIRIFYDRVRSDMISKEMGFQLQTPLLRNLGFIGGDINRQVMVV